MDIIHVGLYGGKSIFGGKETPLVADVIYCDKYNQCSYHCNKQCLKIRSLGRYCKFGKVNSIKGYTSKAKKYNEFKQEWTKHEKYNVLKMAPDKLGIIENTVVIPYPHLGLYEKNGEYFFKKEPFGTNSINFIPIESFTLEFIITMCKHKPYALFGGEIKDYQNKYVPLFLTHLKEVMPKKYNELIKKYPEFNKSIDVKGRKAILKTINPSPIYYTSLNYPELNETWDWDGEYLIYKKGYLSSINAIRDYEVVDLKIKPTDKSVVIITDNEQINENTIFVD